MRSRKEDFGRNVNFLDPLLRLPQRGSSVNKRAVIITVSGDPHSGGEVSSERALGYIVKKYASFAKLPGVSPLDLRHRFGYRMAESVPLHRLAQIMEHDSFDTTRMSIQGTRRDLQQAVEIIAWT